MPHPRRRTGGGVMWSDAFPQVTERVLNELQIATCRDIYEHRGLLKLVRSDPCLSVRVPPPLRAGGYGAGPCHAAHACCWALALHGNVVSVFLFHLPRHPRGPRRGAQRRTEEHQACRPAHPGLRGARTMWALKRVCGVVCFDCVAARREPLPTSAAWRSWRHAAARFAPAWPRMWRGSNW